ncbi:FecR family protein [Aquimarina sp. TRL1]|uniref:FecR family protein n=1 Tax=Aquimarina sp. (strain TRL1) TaxID=2736252 RepID=UPI00158B2385|nr:FecR domain-containing protein [Aquimarina sp. TRL1]QKX04363.1 FecR family protein [Aquimarina sp. TRL1]
MINYLTIIKKYLNNTISSSEREMLWQWLQNDARNRTLFKEEIKKWYQRQEKKEDVDPNSAYLRFMTAITKKRPSFLQKIISFHPIRYAAALLCGILFGAYFLYTNTDIFPSSERVPFVTEYPNSDNKVKIVQSDGSITYIDLEGQTQLTDQTGGVIGTKNKDQLVLASKTTAREAAFMEISIPKGNMFQLTLADGTKVWLNASSSLKFPQSFDPSDTNRIVYLEGEAFFDVTKNKAQPFIVKTKDIDVSVLGTQFNVSSYQDDEAIKTTLVEGSVAIHQKNNTAKKMILTPSYQAVFDKKQQSIHQKKVNTTVYTSWMSKKIIIQNETFAEVSKRIERAYNVSIHSHNKKLNTTRFTGEFDIENIEEIFMTFSKTLEFTYEIKDNTITINP